MRKISYLTTMIVVLVLFIITWLSMVRDDKAMSGERIISGTGTVRFIGLEVGFYGIIGDDGKNYDPINLGQEFQVDGLRVLFEAKVLEGVVSAHMWGTQIEMLKIQKLE